MAEANPTTSEIVSLASELQEESARLYEGLAARFPALAERFTAFAAEDRKGGLQIVRTYQETISDALEACFCFRGLRLADHRPHAELPGGASLAASLEAAIAFEDGVVALYTLIAARSQALLATIPAAFRRVAAVRQRRLETLRGLRANTG